MTDDESQPELQPQVFANRWANTLGPGHGGRDRCGCLSPLRERQPRKTRFHADRQDTSARGWLHLLDLIEEAAADGREEFRPLAEMDADERRDIVTLPPSIAKLTAVKHFVLYGSNLVRIPPEIGAMTGLEVFSPYTSYRLHWFPYELTRCVHLRDSTVSTRAVYGNFKYRAPFPRLRPDPDAGGGPALDPDDLDPGVWGVPSVRTCSVCDGPIGATGPWQAWISLWVATDVLPLLVNACSRACVDALPQGAEHHVRTSHKGGPDVVQPEPRW
jgi:hypothetical protein